MKTYYYTPSNPELYHHGIKGMRWGVRRSEKQLARVRGKKADDVHEDYKRAHSKKSVKSMSNQELQERNKRLQMESQYAQLKSQTGKGQKIINAAKAFTTVATVTAGVVTAYGTYKNLAGKAANSKATNKVIDKIGDYVVKDIKFGKVH